MVRVMGKTGSRPFDGHRFKQRLADQVLGHPVAPGIADDFAGADILVTGQVKPPLIGGNVGDVRQPNHIGNGRRKFLGQQVFSHRQGVVGVGGGFKFSLLAAADAEFTAQSLDPANPNPHPMIRQILLQTLRAVALPGPAAVGRLDLYRQPGVLPLPARR